MFCVNVLIASSTMIPSDLQLISFYSCGKGMFSKKGKFPGAGSLTAYTEMSWCQREPMSSEVRFKLCLDAKNGKSKISTPHTLCYTNKVNSETGST